MMLIRFNKHLSEKITLLIGIACLIAGSTVLLGWYTNNKLLFHLFIGDVPIRYNSALCYLSLGIALVALHRSYQVASFVAGLFITIVGGLTISQNIFQINLGIDELLFKQYYTVNTISAGRMSPQAATSYFFSGLSLLLLWKKPLPLERVKLAITLSIVPIVIGMLSLIGHLADWKTTYAWLYDSHNALPTALMFIIVNTTLILFASCNQAKAQLATANPQFVLVVVATLTILLWRDIYQAGLKHLYEITQFQNELITKYIHQRLQDSVLDLQAIKKSWEESEMTKDEWLKSAKLFLNTEQQAITLMWVDPTRRKVLAPAVQNSEAFRTLIESDQEEIVNTFNDAIKRKDISFSSIITYGNNEKAILFCIPLYRQGELSGFMIEAVEATYFVKDLITGSLGVGFLVTIQSDNQPLSIFTSPQTPDLLFPNINVTKNVTFNNLNWSVSIKPSLTLATQQTNVVLSYFVLIMGLFLAFVLYSYMKMLVLNKHLKAEIEERKQLELKNASLNDQLVTAARYAGMADIASSMLHNIGNTLNSVSVSVGVIHEKLEKSRMSSLADIVHMLQENQEHLGQYFESDPKGKIIPEYLQKLYQTWDSDCEIIENEIQSLNRNVEIIHSIVSNQSSLNTSFEISQEAVISDLVNEALTLNTYLLQDDNIEIIREYTPLQPAIIDKVKLLQVLTNLIKNGIEAMKDITSKNMQLILRIKGFNEDYFMIQIQDIGHGISSENKAKIFTQGFTTKVNGHGIGLHASAIAIGSMGGKCTFDSLGIGSGATFTIILPYQPVTKHQEAVA